MSSIEAQLAEYRRTKKEKADKAAADQTPSSTIDHRGDSAQHQPSFLSSSLRLSSLLLSRFHSLLTDNAIARPLSAYFLLHPWHRRFLLLLLWLVGQLQFARWHFGAVYFALSLLLFLYASLSSDGERRPGEMSAYSVFNPNCQRLPGQMTAEQFESEVLRRNVAPRSD